MPRDVRIRQGMLITLRVEVTIYADLIGRAGAAIDQHLGFDGPWAIARTLSVLPTPR